MGEPTSSSKESGSWRSLVGDLFARKVSIEAVAGGVDLLVPIGIRSDRLLAGARVDLVGVPDANTDRYSDPVGVKAFRILPLKSASTSVKSIVFAHSTVEGLTPVNATLVAHAAAQQGLTPGVDYDNVGSLVAQFQGAINTANAGTGQLWAGDIGWTKWDGVNRIKTIAVGAVGGTHAHGIILQLVR